nr:CASP-like protein 4U1 [Microcebus murinus]
MALSKRKALINSKEARWRGGGAAAPQLPSPPRAPPAGPGPSPPWPPPPELVPEPATCPYWAATASCAAASASEWSALEFEQGPEPSQRHLRSRPPPPSSNSRSLRHSASHRPRAAARPRSQSRGRLLKPPRRRRAPHDPAPAIGPAAGPDGSCSPGPRGRDAENLAGDRAAGGAVAAGLARTGSGAVSSSRPRRETQDNWNMFSGDSNILWGINCCLVLLCSSSKNLRWICNLPWPKENDRSDISLSFEKP